MDKKVMAGDIIKVKSTMHRGECLVRNWDPTKEDSLIDWVRQNYGQTIEFVIVNDDLNPGKLMAEASSPIERWEEVTVHWVTDDEAGVTKKDGTILVLKINDDDYFVVREFPKVDYRSQICKMSDEDLKAALNDLRSSRGSAPKLIRHKKKRDPLESALALMSKSERQVLMSKLGLS